MRTPCKDPNFPSLMIFLMCPSIDVEPWNFVSKLKIKIIILLIMTIAMTSIKSYKYVAQLLQQIFWSIKKS